MDNNQVNTERRSRITNPTPYGGLGKLPPQAVDLEEAVLGAIMLEKDAILTVADILSSDCFYKDNHQKIYDVIQKLQAKAEPVDILTVTAELRKEGTLEMIGGAYYITELTSRVASAGNIEFHARIILQQWIKRELIRINTAAVQECYEDTSDVFDVLSRTEFEKDRLINLLNSRKEISNAELLTGRLQHLEKAGLSADHLTGVPSGFLELDRITAGWQKSDLIILAARPGMGKTSLALQAAVNAARRDVPVAVFSLEMSADQLMDKEISIETEIPLWKFKKNGLNSEDWEQIKYHRSGLAMLPIQWDDTPALNIVEFRAKARRLKSKYDIQLIVIDYLQLIQAVMQNKNTIREQEIGFISRSLKATAKELNIPIIALSQLSRKVEDRAGGSKRPQLSDLRESGSIEQDADMVIFLYRPEYYGLDLDANNMPTDGLAEVIIAKHRNGDNGDVVLKFSKETTGFKDDSPGFIPAGITDRF